MRLYEIIPGKLYQRGALRRVSPEKGVRLLQEHGITHMLALWHPDSPEIRAAVHYFHYPMPDGKALNRDELWAISRMMADYIHLGGRVLVTCHAGRNRSGLMNALIVRRLLKCSGAQALAEVRARRPNAVANPTFAAYLEGLPGFDGA